MTPSVFQKTFEKASVGMVLMDGEGKVVLANGAFGHILGLPAAVTQGSSLEPYLERRDYEAWEGFFTDFTAGTATDYYFESMFLPRDGRKAWWSLQLADIAHTDEDGHPLIFMVVQDISLKKIYENKLREARQTADRANRAKSQFLANISHEIRTPIHSIITLAELLNETRLDKDQKDLVGKLGNASDILLSLVRDVLDFSKIEADRLELEIDDFDVSRVVDQALTLVATAAEEKGLELVVDEPEDLPPLLRGDANRLRQVLVNILTNSVKFTPEGEIILRIRTQARTDGSVQLEFTIIDTGIGISPDHQANIFEPFYQADSSNTREFGGTGLGLSIARRMVNLMGGDIQLDSTPGMGTQVRFTVLCSPAKGTPAPLASLKGAQRKILLVDQTPSRRALLTTALTAWDFRVTPAAHLTDAERLLQDQDFDLLVLDGRLQSPDPAHWILQFRSRPGRQGVPIILLEGLKSEPPGKNFDPCLVPLPKPVRRTTLQRTLTAAFSVQPASNTADSPEPDTPEAGLPPLKILVAEDHDVNRELFKLLLTQMGHQVLLAVNGEEVVTLQTQQNPDLIFMDLQMPVCNGFEATAKIRRSGSSVPIVAVTASALKGEWERCLQAGMNGCMTKPFRASDLAKTLQNLWNTPETRAFFQTSPAQSPTSEAFSWEECLEVFLGKEDLVRRLLGKFTEKTQTHLEGISAALSPPNTGKIREQAHAIKGSAFNLTAKKLGTAAGALESAARDGQIQELSPLYQDLVRAFEDFKTAILPWQGS